MPKKQCNLSAHDRKLGHDIFLMSIEWLEKYIEIVYKNEFPDWENRKQIRDNLNIKRTDIYQNPQKLEKSLSTQLFLLESSLEHEPLRKELRQEFYKWINAVGIDANNCPKRLKHYLFGINEMLEGRGGKLLKDAENRKRDVEIDSPEYLEQMSSLFANIQAPMRDEGEVEKALKGKKHTDIEIGSKFGNANAAEGEQVINQITSQVANQHDSFYFYPQKQQQENDKPKPLNCGNEGNFITQRQQELAKKNSKNGELWALGAIGGTAVLITAWLIKIFVKRQFNLKAKQNRQKQGNR